MNRNRPALPGIPALAAAVAVVSSFAAAAPASSEQVVFRFAPPIGSSFVSRELQETELRIGATREKHTTAILSTISLQREGGMIYIAHRFDQIAGAKEGEKFETPPQVEAMKGSRIVHVLRPDGSLQRVDGYAAIAAKALPKMKPKARESLQKMIDEGRQDARDRAGWFELEMLIEQTLDLDRDYWFPSAWSDEEGWTRHDTLLRLGPWVDHPGAGRLLTVQLAYVEDAVAVIPGAIRLSSRIASRFDPLKPGKIARGQKFEGSASWLIDPRSCVVWKIQTFRKVSQPIQVNSDIGLTLVTEQRATKTLEAPPAKAQL